MASSDSAVRLHSLDVEAGREDHSQAGFTTRRTILGKRNVIEYQHRRRNDMLLSLGLLELGNATDFAANVWNGTPPPTISIVFMALGGTAALTILAFAYRDIPRTWRNSQLLRRERAGLRARLDACTKTKNTTPGRLTEHDLLTHVDVNTRELGNEYVDRLAMGLTLGFGAFTVGIGTYLAIAGANDVAFLASNILTGYLGNIPAAIYGLGNAAWCTYGWRRAESHNQSVREKLPDSSPWGARVYILGLVQQREGRVKTHALINGISGMLGGIGSLMTATAYIHPHAVWGYLILIPCVVSAMFANIMWRKRINYDRDLTEPVALDGETLLLDTGYAALRERLVAEYCRTAGVYHWPPLSGRRKARRPADLPERMHAFVLGFLRLHVEMLTHRNARLLDKIPVVAAKPPTIDGSAVLQSLREQHNRTTLSLAETKTMLSTLNHSKSPSLQVLVKSLLAVLTDLNILPELYVRLANSSSTSFLVNGVDIDLDAMEEILGDDEDACTAFLRTAEAVLVNEGVEAARSRTRYLLEVVGCFWQEVKWGV